ncbi:ATP binding cassette subfamily G member 2 (Junior blood group) L homeolog isoform X1 [Xenopus laevis]|uniref:Broad substrate specificity ATP-binding cassette transporter ABCG2 n=3 Tax=Xenopus laevis TaxID=8355 RepID=A0A8J1M7G5_XENLA|nr:ATP binding cassette subfamily G member 2 (Junior blood group) L homeolog isoform X1 [Xenopus laevis]XP_018102834.1 ATP binding cassette subfamily G member 2 (Junior blood group) L homeolog isoform X1 [Xenopus laevis]XP_041437644.1 ATP binding cassette subfamily G member 2 (Junior blood group) L homeolog isoform X1 [Xenopus laevis]
MYDPTVKYQPCSTADTLDTISMTDKQPQTIVQMVEPLANGEVKKKGLKKKLSGAVLSFYNINYKVKVKSGLICRRKVTERIILNDVNGIMKPGLNAILGPTGSGKSSLLDVLAARKDPNGLTGQVLVDGEPQPPNFKCLSGYVVQDDVVMGTLSIRENLQFSAALRLPRSVKQKEKDERINQILKELGLTKVADSKVGTQFIRGVSGGERKRTNIGMELITDPGILFLDEPTTGLDASTANAVLLLLKRMSRQGKTIIFSIHQPRYSIFRLFDSLTLLAGGSLLFHGPSADALDYFTGLGYECESHNNPADFFLDIINGDSTAVALNKLEEVELENVQKEVNDNGCKTVVENLSAQFCTTSYYLETKSELEKMSQGKKVKINFFTRQITYNTSFLHQLKWVCKRSFRNLLRNPQASIAQVLVTLVLALIVGAIFFGVKEDVSGIQNRVGSLFFVTTNQCFSSVSAIELFIVEKKIFIHEYISGYYRLSAYFFAKLFTDLLPMRTLPSIIFTAVLYFMIGFKATAGAFFIMMFTLTMIAYTAASMALAVAAGQDVVAVANLLMTICFVFMIIFSGLLVNLTSIMSWISWLKYFSIPRYGLTALQVNEFTNLNFCRSNNTSIPVNPNCTQSSPFTTCTGEEYLTVQGIDYSTWGLWQNHLALACMTIIFLTIAYLKLYFMKKLT